MQEDDDILIELAAKFPFLDGKMRIQRARRIYVETSADNFQRVLDYLYGPMRFIMLTAITGLDTKPTFTVHYHLARNSGVLLTLTNAVPQENPVIHTITSYFPAADAYERELVDLLGMRVDGLPEGSRYPLPDGWPVGQFPLRKDWTADKLQPEGASAAAHPASPATQPPVKESTHA